MTSEGQRFLLTAGFSTLSSILFQALRWPGFDAATSPGCMAWQSRGWDAVIVMPAGDSPTPLKATLVSAALPMSCFMFFVCCDCF